MDDAWWGASLAGELPTAARGSWWASARCPTRSSWTPTGERFANESESYVDLGHHMLEHDERRCGPASILDDQRRPARPALPAQLRDGPARNKALAPASWSQGRQRWRGWLGKIGVDRPRPCRATIERFNGFARSGVDQDFGRGNSAYDRYYGDPLVRPNPNLGPLEKAPFHAYRIVIGDLGTKGGVLTDTEARALRDDGSVISARQPCSACERRDAWHATKTDTSSVLDGARLSPRQAWAQSSAGGRRGWGQREAASVQCPPRRHGCADATPARATGSPRRSPSATAPKMPTGTASSTSPPATSSA